MRRPARSPATGGPAGLFHRGLRLSRRGLSPQTVGRAGEWYACLALTLRGYRILARNLVTPHGEVDILARDGEVIVVVEVKTRRGAATRVLPSEQQRRLVRASDWAQSRWGKPGVEARVDLVRVDASEFRWWRPWPRLRIERGIRYSRGL